MAALTVTAVSPYLAEATKGAAGKVGEAAIEGGAKLFRFLKSKLRGADEKALSRVEREPGNADYQAALRVALTEWAERDPASRDELAALLKALPPTTVAHQSANIVGDGNEVVQAAGTKISIGFGSGRLAGDPQIDPPPPKPTRYPRKRRR
jgi:hypothetical protein